MKFILGPCAIETREHTLKLAGILKLIEEYLVNVGFDFEIIFKASYSKPNRSDFSSFSGVGIQEGLRILQEVKEKYGFKVTSDVHTPMEALEAGEVLDIIQIPHQLCKNTPLVVSAATTKKMVSIKKGTFYDAKLFHHLVDKVRACGNTNPVIAIERGNHFGYGNTIVDMRNLGLLGLNKDGIQDAGVITCLDVTHPGSGPKGARILAGAGIGAGADMLFMEIHDNPSKALCDGQCVLPIKGLLPFIYKLLSIKRAVDLCIDFDG